LEDGHVIKTGRTHLMDALPIRLGAELEAWAAALDECLERFSAVMPRLLRLPLGGTAVGSGVNCHPDFSALAIKRINGMTDLACTVAANFYKGLSSLDTVVETSGQLRTAAVVLIKICNDLRWMNSGPGAGFAEIALPALQPGSSIMPAKVNPVIPEAVLMACAQIMGNDHVVALAGQGGSFQLNTMLPVAAHNILHSIDLLSGSARDLADKAVAGFTVNEEVCGRFVSRNPILVTALNAKIGYLAAAEIAKKAMAEDRSVLEIALEETDLPRAELEELLDPARLADGG
jgi:fumarate hydratase class II